MVLFRMQMSSFGDHLVHLVEIKGIHLVHLVEIKDIHLVHLVEKLRLIFNM
jgi:hypothetical protein